jgi:hypothetical protein
MRDVLVECLDSPGCTLLELDASRRKLVLMVTTGISRRGPNSNWALHNPNNRDTEEYDVDRDVNIMTYLAHHPNELVRKTNLIHKNECEMGFPSDLPSADFSRWWDRDIPSHERRFMAMSLAPIQETLAVVRLARPMHRPAFSSADAELFRALMDVWGRRLAFERAKKEETSPVFFDVGGEGGYA